jgi:hypothetical protein
LQAVGLIPDTAVMLGCSTDPLKIELKAF